MRYVVVPALSVLLAVAAWGIGWLDEPTPVYWCVGTVITSLVIMYLKRRTAPRDLPGADAWFAFVASGLLAWLVGTRNWSDFTHDAAATVSLAALALLLTGYGYRLLQRPVSRTY